MSARVGSIHGGLQETPTFSIYTCMAKVILAVHPFHNQLTVIIVEFENNNKLKLYIYPHPLFIFNASEIFRVFASELSTTPASAPARGSSPGGSPTIYRPIFPFSLPLPLPPRSHQPSIDPSSPFPSLSLSLSLGEP